MKVWISQMILARFVIRRPGAFPEQELVVLYNRFPLTLTTGGVWHRVI